MRYILTLIFTILLLLGCQESSNIVEPLDSPTSRSIKKDLESGYELFALPPKAP